MKLSQLSFPNKNGKGLRIGVVVARWNSVYTYSLRDAALDELRACGVKQKNIFVQEVPGSYELVFAAAQLSEQKKVDAIICIGVLIKGETMHFEYIAQAVSQGIMELNSDESVPVVFGVLTCLNEKQVRVRSTGKQNHGAAWADTAIEMGLFAKKIQKKK
ncbi:MAG: 6,7-dimethyl-8-ribityllumazine synthase [Candidatus Magasanikbacteria bacterium]|nr:6,7-dimethyl-8-ribityllumazine synthase [Candidatus Magasanikbacteria bacterium]